MSPRASHTCPSKCRALHCPHETAELGCFLLRPRPSSEILGSVVVQEGLKGPMREAIHKETHKHQTQEDTFQEVNFRTHAFMMTHHNGVVLRPHPN